MPKKIYKKKVSKNFFTKNGKELKSYKDFNAVYSLQDSGETETVNQIVEPEPVENSLVEKIKNDAVSTKIFLVEKARELQGKIKSVDRLKFSMVSLGINAALVVAVMFLIANNHTSKRYSPRYSIFSSKPLTTLVASANLFGGDTRAAQLDKILEAYNCPLAGHGKTFVKEADKSGIPHWLTASIAFQESSCGKTTPQTKIAGQEDITNPDDLEFEESYNAWGWGVWGEHVKKFDGWEAGIKAVSEYLGANFYSKGVTDTCEIMKTYTPSSDGSWCQGVNYFGEMIQNYTSPQN